MEKKRFHCDHCGEKISKSLYFDHKRLYYSPASNTWKKITKGDMESQIFQDFDFADSSYEAESGPGGNYFHC